MYPIVVLDFNFVLRALSLTERGAPSEGKSLGTKLTNLNFCRSIQLDVLFSYTVLTMALTRFSRTIFVEQSPFALGVKPFTFKSVDKTLMRDH